MSHNLKRHLLHALRLAPVFVFSLLVVTPGQYALADASGCSRFGIDGLTCIAVKGHGLRIYSIKARFDKVTTLCNWRYDIVYTQTNGTNYSTRKGPTHPGCNFSGDLPVTYTPYTNVRTGKVCAQLYSDGSYVDAACVSLFP
jgi:hypothetical protein